MRFLLFVVAAVAVGLCGEPPAPPDARKQAAEAANVAFQRGLECEKHNDLAGAITYLRRALELSPGNHDYAQALAADSQKLTDQYLRDGNAALGRDEPAAAIALFNAALNLDPSNGFASQRLRDANVLLPHHRTELERAAESSEVQLLPRSGKVSLHFGGDTRALLTQVATSFGLTATFDERFTTRTVILDLNDASFGQIFPVAIDLARAMWVAKSSHEIFFANNTPENHRLFDRVIVRDFYLPEISSPQELNDIASTLRTIFELRTVPLNPQRSMLSVRASQPVMDTIATFLDNLRYSRPQVELDVRIYEIDYNFLRNLGLQIPSQFQIINIPPAALNLLQQGNIQQQIQNLIANGGLTAANQQAINALLAQLQQQQAAGLTSLLNQPFVTFGNGQSLFAVTYPGQFQFNFNFNDSWMRSLEHLTLRASQGDTATMLIGTRYPVLTSTFGFSSTANSGLANFPSFTYEDLGVSLKAKPQVHIFPFEHTPNNPVPVQPPAELTLDLELSIKALTGTTINTIPIISSRTFKGDVRLMDGEPALLIGTISRNLMNGISGIAGLGQIPAIGYGFSNLNNNNTEDELLVIIIPHVIHLPEGGQSALLYMPPGVSR